MNYIGTDIQISNLDFKVVNNAGKAKMADKVLTRTFGFKDVIQHFNL